MLTGRLGPNSAVSKQTAWQAIPAGLFLFTSGEYSGAVPMDIWKVGGAGLNDS